MVKLPSSKLAYFSLLHDNHSPVNICKDIQGRKNRENLMPLGIWEFGGGFLIFFCKKLISWHKMDCQRQGRKGKNDS